MFIIDPLNPSQICGKKRSVPMSRNRAGSVPSSGTSKSPQVRTPPDYGLQVKIETIGAMADTYCILAEVRSNHGKTLL